MDRAELIQLYEEMVDRFDLSELRTLTFYLGISHEEFTQKKSDFVRELIQYLSRQDRFSELAQNLNRLRPSFDWEAIFIVQADLGRPRQVFTWDQLREYSQQQHGRFWQATQESPPIYVSELYVSSPQTEAELENFLTGDATALIVLGETGAGKTNLLCQWTSDLMQAGHAVFYYDCAGSIQDKIEDDIARDLNKAAPEELADLLEQVSQLAEGAEKHLVLIFDAINEYRRANQVGTAAILRQIDALVGRLPEHNIKVVFSCRTIPWKRLRTVGVPRLTRQRYHKPAAGMEPHLLLPPFDSTTLELAYKKYQAHFELQTSYDELPPSARENLANPLLLSILAEAYKELSVPEATETLFLSIFKRYYEKQVKTNAEKRLIALVVEAMYGCNRSVLWLKDLEQSYPELREEILKEEPDSPYQRMLARGVLLETSGEYNQSTQVRFRYDSAGSYALALYVLNQSDPTVSRLTELVCEKREFHLTWEAALFLLLLQPYVETFTTISQSHDPELRELAVTALVEYHAAKPEEALNIVNQLIALDNAEAQHTALKAAYFIGSEAQTVFLDVASNRDDALREVTKDALYLIWRRDPDFVNDLLRILCSRIELKALHQIPALLDFVIDLSVTIYINHCDDPGMPQQISDLFHDLVKDQLPLGDLLRPVLSTLGQSNAIVKKVTKAIDSGVARPVIESFHDEEATAAYRANYATDAAKENLREVLKLVKPGSDLKPHLDNMAEMLQSQVPLVNLLAALPLAVQACDDFGTTGPLMRQLFDYDQMNGHGRLWIILSLALQFKDTPSGWVELLEEFTGRLIAENEETYYGERGGFFEQFDIVLVPLGLAYGKQGTSMPLFENLVREGVAAEQWSKLTRTMEALGPVGFYYPRAIFRTLTAAVDDFEQEEIQKMLVEPLALMRILHMDEVDGFLQYIEAGDDFKRRVVATMNIEGVSNYIYRLGIYNSTVYDALHHPKMSEKFLIGSVEVLIDTQDRQEFLAYYAQAVMDMSREVDYNIIEWTYSA